MKKGDRIIIEIRKHYAFWDYNKSKPLTRRAIVRDSYSEGGDVDISFTQPVCFKDYDGYWFTHGVTLSNNHITYYVSQDDHKKYPMGDIDPYYRILYHHESYESALCFLCIVWSRQYPLFTNKDVARIIAKNIYYSCVTY